MEVLNKLRFLAINKFFEDGPWAQGFEALVVSEMISETKKFKLGLGLKVQRFSWLDKFRILIKNEPLSD